MTTNADLVTLALCETIACQDVDSPQFRGRCEGAFSPLGPYLPAGPGGGQYATTDAAMDAIARLADGVRDADPALLRGVARDTIRRQTAAAFAELLPKLVHEDDDRARWRRLRSCIRDRLAVLRVDLVHYIPVWLFVGQVCAPFEVGPVRFVRREDWLTEIASRRGASVSWLEDVRAIWTADRQRAALRARGLGPDTIADPVAGSGTVFDDAVASVGHAAERVAKGAHPDQWIACVHVAGFEEAESRRRAVLAARVALDAVRLLLPNGHRHRLRTSIDHGPPHGVDRFRQKAGADLVWAGSAERAGVSGEPGLALQIVANGTEVLSAAGECIREACDAVPPMAAPLPLLSRRWFDAVHWFGRACLADADFAGVVFAAVSLDVLSGGGEKWGITELLSTLTGHPRDAEVLGDGTSLEKLVDRVYALRSRIAHGSVLALHGEHDVERAQLQDLAAVALRQYALTLGPHAAAGGLDGEDPLAVGLGRRAQSTSSAVPAS